jgi:hypothetical protein
MILDLDVDPLREGGSTVINIVRAGLLVILMMNILGIGHHPVDAGMSCKGRL